MALGLSAAAWAGIGAITSAGVGIYSANKASSTQAGAAAAAGERSDRQFDISRDDQLKQLAQQREDSTPYREAGYKSLAQLMAGTAPGGEFAQEYQRGSFEADPGYKFRLEQGEAGLNREAAANGSKYSGAALKALARFNSGLASQEYGNFDARQNQQQALFEGSKTNRFNRLASLAQTGQTANQALANNGQQVNSNIAQLGNANENRVGNYMTDAAEARASGYVATGKAINSGITNLYNAFKG
jgi:hypothetical protein